MRRRGNSSRCGIDPPADCSSACSVRIALTVASTRPSISVTAPATARGSLGVGELTGGGRERTGGRRHLWQRRTDDAVAGARSRAHAGRRRRARACSRRAARSAQGSPRSAAVGPCRSRPWSGIGDIAARAVHLTGGQRTRDDAVAVTGQRAHRRDRRAILADERRHRVRQLVRDRGLEVIASLGQRIRPQAAVPGLLDLLGEGCEHHDRVLRRFRAPEDEAGQPREEQVVERGRRPPPSGSPRRPS